VGEVAVRSSQLMLGYYRDEDLTRQSIDSEGWFFTGDIGAWQPDGSLCLLERKKDLIIRGGQNIYPAEIETYLARHPDIYRAAVVGVPHPLSGEAIWAFVQPRPGRALAACQVLDFCRGQIAPYKIPDQVRLINRLPMSAPGKVQKYRLRQMAADEIADQSQIDYRTTDTHG
jgi:acyl-CoA synthetase (AMP-forming)/AMP-acid ligase II